MFSLKSLLSSVTRRKTRRSSMALELLEQRQLMTITMSVAPGGVLMINGDDTADTVNVYKNGSSTFVQSTNSVGVYTTVNVGDQITRMEIRTNGGNDVVNNMTSMPAIIRGGLGDDALNGGSSSDELYGDDGNDTLRGNGGYDILRGGNGNDTLYGNAGIDELFGNAGNDVMYGGGGSDYLSGGTGSDRLYGDDSSGSTWVDGEAAGRDSLYGGDGNDSLNGGFNHDRLAGGNGDDYLYGNSGNDRLFGDAGLDTLFGQGGNDFLDPGSDGEISDGGAGNDFRAYSTAVNGTTMSDIAQGGSNNCFILASMGTAAARGVNMASRITYIGNCYYNVALFNRTATGSYSPTTVLVHFDGTLLATDPKAHFRGQEGESWPIIMNRALAQLLNVNLTTTTGGYAGNVLGAILGRAPSTTEWIDNSGVVSTMFRDPVLDRLFAVGNSLPTIVGTRNTMSQLGSTLFAEDHVYMVQAVYISHYVFSPLTLQHIPQYTIVLYNPWGTDTNAERLANGTGRPSGDNNDGLLVISGSEFKRNFDEITCA